MATLTDDELILLVEMCLEEGQNVGQTCKTVRDHIGGGMVDGFNRTVWVLLQLHRKGNARVRQVVDAWNQHASGMGRIHLKD